MTETTVFQDRLVMTASIYLRALILNSFRKGLPLPFKLSLASIVTIISPTPQNVKCFCAKKAEPNGSAFSFYGILLEWQVR